MAYIVAALVGFGMLLLIYAVQILAYVLQGFVLSTIWGWLAVPLFAVPELTVAMGMVIMLVTGFVFKGAEKAPTDNAKVVEVVFKVDFLRPVLYLFSAFIIKLVLGL